MKPSFLIPCTISLLSAFITYQSQEEMVISLLVSFAWTSWLVQILILVKSLRAMRYFCDRHSCQNAGKFR